MSERIFNNNKDFSACIESNREKVHFGESGYLSVIKSFIMTFTAMSGCGGCGRGKLQTAEEDAERLYQEYVMKLWEMEPHTITQFKVILDVDKIIFKSAGETFLEV